MPLRGENVGTAYVRIIGDGSGIDADIRRALDDAEPSVREGARDQGRTYGDEFNKEVRKSFKGNFGKTQREMFEELNENLTKALARQELSERFFNNTNWKKFRRRLADEGGAAGELFGKRLEQKFRDSGALERMGDSLSAFGPELRRAQTDILNDLHADALRMNADFNRRMQAQRADEDRKLEAHWRRLGDMVDAYAEHERRLEKDYEHIRHEVDLLIKGETKLVDSKKTLLRSVDSLRVGYRSLGKADKDFLEDLLLIERRIRFTQPRLNAFDRGIQRVADRMGRGFGRGARNDFINLIGATVRGMFSLLRVIPLTLSMVGKVKSTFFEGFEKAGGGLPGIVSGFVATLGPLAIGLAAAGAGLAALMVIIGPLIALMSSLLGIVVALASSLAFALVGALGAVAGALLPMAAGAVVAAVAFTNLDKAQKKVLKNDMKPVVDAFKDLADVAAEGIFSNTAEQGERLGRVLSGFEDLFRRVGVAISDVADGWLDMMEGPGFKRFRDEFSVSLPGMVRRLGRIFGNTIGGLGGILLALEPTIQRFLGWLDRVTRRFNEWANSAKGRNEIENFFDRASDSAESVWNFLTSLWDVLMRIMSAGQESGDNMFDRMARGLDNIGQFFEENPNALQDWFDQAERIFDDLGDLLEGATAFIDKMDSAWSRFASSNIIRLIALTFRILGRAIGEVERRLSQTLQMAEDFGRGVSRAFRRIVGTARDVGNSIRIFFGNQMERTRQRAANAIDAIVGFWRRLPGRAAAAAASIVGQAAALFQRIQTRAASEIGQIVGFFARLPGRAASALAGIVGRVAGIFADIPARVGRIVDDIVSEFAGLAGRILSAIGTIDIGSLIKVPNPGGGVPFVPGMASGGILTHARIIRAGEDGPEAIVPLDRDLGRVDPAVRMLSAFAQGKIPNFAGGGIAGVGKTIDVGGITVISPAADPRAVAQETVNRLVALGY